MSDEPADPPLPDNTLEASPNNRGPIAASKRASLSIGSGFTSVTNNTGIPPPATTIVPGPQDTRGDLSILSTAGSVSTPEKDGGLEISGSPSTSLTGIFGSSAIPITTNDLGRLPLHYGVKFPMDFDFPAIASGWNASGSGRASTSLGGANQNSGSGQVDGVNSGGTQSRRNYGIFPPQEQHPEDLFPWIPYTTTVGAREIAVDSVPILATAEATTRPNAAPTYVPAYCSQTKPTADQLDSTISSLFGNVPSTSSTVLGMLTDSLPGPVSNTTENRTNLFEALFPPPHTLVDTYLPPTARGTQQPHDGHEQGYESLPVDAQAYLHGWSNAPQAFE